MQPIIGTLSDKSTSKYGRRRPYMVGGTIAVVTCYLILGWAKEIAGLFVSNAERQRRFAIILAIIDIFILDFVINVAQATCRALVVDTLSISQQHAGAAWVSRMAGIGHLLVYAVGAMDLKAIMGNTLGDTQFKKVCVIAAISMAVAQGLSCWAVQERVLVEERETKDKGQSLISIASQIYSTLLHLPERIQAICWVQFWSWIGWFPFLFYGSTWVGEIYLRYHPDRDQSKEALDEVGQQGSRALIVYSIVTTVASIVLPRFIQNPGEDERSYTVRPPRSLGSYVSNMRWRKPSMLRSWALANLLFTTTMIFAPIVRSVAFATVLMGICGIPAAIGGLAAVTFLGVEVNRMSSGLPITRSRTSSHRKSTESAIELDGGPVTRSRSSSPKMLHLRHDSNASLVPNSTGELSGIYLGILNIYTTLPQFVGTGISWIVFSILEPGKSPELATDFDPDQQEDHAGISAIGVCLFIGALSAGGAAWACRRLKSAH